MNKKTLIALVARVFSKKDKAPNGIKQYGWACKRCDYLQYDPDRKTANRKYRHHLKIAHDIYPINIAFANRTIKIALDILIIPKDIK